MANNNTIVKYTYILIFFVIFISSCNRKEAIVSNKNYVFFKGYFPKEIMNFTFSVTDIFSDEKEVHLVEIDSLGHFDYSIPIDFPQSIIIGISSTQNIPVIAFPNDTITIVFDKNIELKYSNLKHQNYFDNLEFIQHEIQKSINNRLGPDIFKSLSENNFKLLLNSVKKNLEIKLDSISRQKKLDDIIIQDLKNEINFFIFSTIADYEFLNKFIFRQERNIPKDFYSIQDTLYNNFKKIILTSNAFNFFNRIQLQYPNPVSENNFNDILKLKTSRIRDILLCRTIYSSIRNKDFTTTKLWMEKYFPEIESKILKSKLNLKYKASLAIYNNPFLTSAKLKYLAQNDKTGILNEITKEHIDKVLYLKFWAPYCGPCMSQLPYLKKVEEKINSDKFLVINICLPYPKDKWKATIKEKNIGGIHYLLNENQYTELKALFNIQGIPIYVIIDKKGEIVDNDAPIPGDEILQGTNFELVEIINKLIN